jgi:predicted permease
MKIWGWNRAKNELQEELDCHLRMAIEERVARDESPEAARAAALKEFGNVPLIADVTRHRWGFEWLENAARDARYALGQLRRSPGFVATVVLTIALGIGANLAVFQLLYSVILARLPLPHTEQLYWVHAAKSPFDQSWQISYPAYQRLRAAAADVPLVARTAFDEGIVQQTDSDSRTAHYQFVSDNYFTGLGVKAAAGRVFGALDARRDQGEWPAVLRYDYARQSFGSAERAVGLHLKINRVPVVVVGVASRRFAEFVSGYAPDFWLPLEAENIKLETAFDSLGPGHGVNLDAPWINQDTVFWLQMVARIPAGRRETVAAQWNQTFQPDRERMTEATTDTQQKVALARQRIELLGVEQGMGGIHKSSRKPLLLLMALSVSIFLVGCLNLANLQLARLTRRGHELGIRMALGASRGRLMGQILIEDFLLVLLGGAAAFLVGRGASGLLVRWASSRDWTMNIDLSPNLAIATLAVALMALALVVFSILPALWFLRRGLASAAGSGTKTVGLTQTGRRGWRSNAVLTAQVSLSLLLTVMSGCFAATLIHWETLDVGMDREHILSVSVDMRRTGYIDRHPQYIDLYRTLREQLGAVEGVRSAAIEMCPMPGCGWATALYVNGGGHLTEEQIHGKEDHVGPGFFATMGIPLLRGRDFAPSDTPKTTTVAILSQSYARQLFGDQDPIGHWVGYEPAPRDHKFLIVGVVADARVDGPQEQAPAMVYMSTSQIPFPVHTIQVRTVGDPEKMAGRIRAAMHRIDPDLPITGIATLGEAFADELGTEKLLARLAAVYAGLTLLLVGIGFYGVMSSRTAARRSEFGVRLALGASRGSICWLVVRQTSWILLTGIVPGLLLSAVGVRLARHLLAESAQANSAAVLGAAVVLAAAGLLATLAPARRASLADPLETLRRE